MAPAVAAPETGLAMGECGCGLMARLHSPTRKHRGASGRAQASLAEASRLAGTPGILARACVAQATDGLDPDCADLQARAMVAHAAIMQAGSRGCPLGPLRHRLAAVTGLPRARELAGNRRHGGRSVCEGPYEAPRRPKGRAGDHAAQRIVSLLIPAQLPRKPIGKPKRSGDARSHATLATTKPASLATT